MSLPLPHLQHNTAYPLSPSPYQGLGTAPLRMGQSSEPGVYEGDEPALHSTPAECACSTPSPCMGQSLSYASVGLTSKVNQSQCSPCDPAAIYANMVTAFQSALCSQVSLHSQQLEQHTCELTNLHMQSHVVLAEYAKYMPLRAAQATH